jgi:hypothetical protein
MKQFPAVKHPSSGGMRQSLEQLGNQYHGGADRSMRTGRPDQMVQLERVAMPARHQSCHPSYQSVFRLVELLYMPMQQVSGVSQKA